MFPSRSSQNTTHCAGTIGGAGFDRVLFLGADGVTGRDYAAIGFDRFRNQHRLTTAAYDTKNNQLLSNLYVRMLHHMGIEAKSFGASTGIISEITETMIFPMMSRMKKRRHSRRARRSRASIGP